MKECSTNSSNGITIINDVDVTGDSLTSRAGLSLFVRYLRGVFALPYLEELFSASPELFSDLAARIAELDVVKFKIDVPCFGQKTKNHFYGGKVKNH